MARSRHTHGAPAPRSPPVFLALAVLCSLPLLWGGCAAVFLRDAAASEAPAGGPTGPSIFASSASDPRSSQRKNFTYGGGGVRVAPLNVALVFLGDGWAACSRTVLEDLFRSLDTNYFNALPKTVFKKNFLSKGINICLPTVRGWWESTVRQYTGAAKRTRATKTLNFLGSYSITSADIKAQKFASVSQMVKYAGGLLVNPVPLQDFDKLSATSKASTVVVLLVGQNVSSSFLQMKLVTKFCAAGYYTGPQRALGPFEGFYGGIITWGPHATNYTTSCNPYPLYSGGFSYSNNCPQADVLSSSLMARLADLATNPSQFQWEQKGDSYILGQKQVTGNTPAWTCKQALAKGSKVAKYNATGVDCSAGQVCDLRRMQQFAISSVGKTGSFSTNATKGSPELTALNSAGVWQTRKASKAAVAIFNVVSSGYLHFIQPYRNSTGSCFSPRWKAGACS